MRARPAQRRAVRRPDARRGPRGRPDPPALPREQPAARAEPGSLAGLDRGVRTSGAGRSGGDNSSCSRRPWIIGALLLKFSDFEVAFARIPEAIPRPVGHPPDCAVQLEVRKTPRSGRHQTSTGGSWSCDAYWASSWSGRSLGWGRVGRMRRPAWAGRTRGLTGSATTSRRPGCTGPATASPATASRGPIRRFRPFPAPPTAPIIPATGSSPAATGSDSGGPGSSAGVCLRPAHLGRFLPAPSRSSRAPGLTADQIAPPPSIGVYAPALGPGIGLYGR